MSITILVVDDELHALKYVSTYFTDQGYQVLTAETLAAARVQIKNGGVDVILLDINLPDGYGLGLMRELEKEPVIPEVIIITGYPEFSYAVDAMRSGAVDFFTKPLDLKELGKSVKRAADIIRMRRELNHYRSESRDTTDFVVGRTPQMKRLIAKAEKAAQAEAQVLITGESGVGKDVLARYISKIGPRAHKPLIALNAAAFQTDLVESELFGYEKGAFTGADKLKRGLVEIADGGILFLDEISLMSYEIQGKVLRVLDNKCFRRVGGTELHETPVDIQIIAATNRDMRKLVAEHKFREDLYYRLNVIELQVPPLRERKDDIATFVGFFVKKENARRGINVTTITPRALDALVNFDWPGNIRQLFHAIESAMTLGDEEKIDINDLPEYITHTTG